MASVFLTPEWFYGYNIALELVFAAITFAVSFYAWKIYKVSEERNVRLFSLAFTFIFSSYIARALLNLVIYLKLEEQICGFIKLQNIYLLNLFGTYIYSILFLVGILLIAYTALKIYSFQTFVLLFLLVFTSLYFTPFKTFMLYLLTLVLLAFVVYYYFRNYLRNKKVTTMLVLIAMMILATGYLSFVFAMNNPIYYFIGHVLEMIAYIIILVNLMLILRPEKDIADIKSEKSKLTKKSKNGKKTR